jgi:hypothetical protein
VITCVVGRPRICKLHLPRVSNLAEIPCRGCRICELRLPRFCNLAETPCRGFRNLPKLLAKKLLACAVLLVPKLRLLRYSLCQNSLPKTPGLCGIPSAKTCPCQCTPSAKTLACAVLVPRDTSLPRPLQGSCTISHDLLRHCWVHAQSHTTCFVIAGF